MRFGDMRRKQVKVFVTKLMVPLFRVSVSHVLFLLASVINRRGAAE